MLSKIWQKTPTSIGGEMNACDVAFKDILLLKQNTCYNSYIGNMFLNPKERGSLCILQ